MTNKNNPAFYGDAEKIEKAYSNDSLNTAFVPANLRTMFDAYSFVWIQL